MQVDIGNDRPEDSGGAEEAKSGAGSIRELLGKAKRHAPERAAKDKGRKPVDPRLAWGAERRAKFNATWARKRAEASGGASETTGKEESILELKDAPEPEKPAPVTKADQEGWAGILLLGHALAAAMLKIPEISSEFDTQKAATLGTASANVARWYSNAVLSEKSQDWIKLGMVAGAIYVPMFKKVKARARAAKEANQMPPPGQNDLGGFERPDVVVEEHEETMQ